MEKESNLYAELIKAHAIDEQLEEQIEDLKNKFVQGYFRDRNLLEQFGHVDCENNLKRFALYRTGAKWENIDNDVSLAAVVMYCMIYDWLELKNIRRQMLFYSSSPCNAWKKFEIKCENGHCYRGDTMTSAWTPFRKYLELLLDGTDDSLHEYKSIMMQLFKKDEGGTLYTTMINNEEYDNFRVAACLQLLLSTNRNFLETVDKVISEEAKKFLDNYMKSGNFIAVPECFNASRSNGGQWDTVDRMLWKIYQYFCNGNDSKYLYEMFTKNKCVAVENCLKWFEDSGINKEDININRWKKFVKENLLEPFVDLDTPDWKPISLKTGAPISEDDEDYRPMPEDLGKCEKFFETVNKGIEERNKLIWEKCKENYAKK